MPRDTLSIVDNRTDKRYEFQLADGAVRATDVRQVKLDDKDYGLLSYDPAYMNTACCRSAVTYIDGDAGVLEYRGYPIEQLAERCTFLEVAYLLLFAELPTRDQLAGWVEEITHRTMLHENVKKFMDGFHHDAHPMGMLISTVAALSTFYPEAREVKDAAVRGLQIRRLIAKMPTIAAFAYRHSRGLPYVYPDNDLSYTENFMNMLWRMTEPRLVTNP